MEDETSDLATAKSVAHCADINDPIIDIGTMGDMAVLVLSVDVQG